MTHTPFVVLLHEVGMDLAEVFQDGLAGRRGGGTVVVDQQLLTAFGEGVADAATHDGEGDVAHRAEASPSPVLAPR